MSPSFWVIRVAVGWPEGRVAVVASCTASCTAASLPFFSFCHARRLIIFVNQHESSEGCFCRNAWSPLRCMYSKIGRNVKFYLSVNRFGTGFSHTILLPPSYHIKIGSGFPTMQFVGLALYSNGVHFFV
jgi:hypothetical protein